MRRGRGRGQTSTSWRQPRQLQGASGHPNANLEAPAQPKVPASTRDWRYIPSISRSRGLDVDGDALTNHGVQEDFFKVISNKLGTYHKELRSRSGEPSEGLREQELNLIILLRKLREGLIASRRRDTFASQVYETSSYLAILANTDRHPASPIFESLVNDFPGAILNALGDDAPLMYLINILVTDYPSQRSFILIFRDLTTRALLSPTSQRFIRKVSNSARRSDFLSLSRLLGSLQLSSLLHERRTPPNPNSLFLDAFHRVVSSFRRKAQETSWRVMRTSYREITSEPATSATRRTSNRWVAKALLLESFQAVEGDQTETSALVVDSHDHLAIEWLEGREKSETKEVERVVVDGKPSPNRWKLFKPS